MVKNLIVAMMTVVLVMFGGCVRSEEAGIDVMVTEAQKPATFYRALHRISQTSDYNFDLQQYTGYEIQIEESVALTNWRAAATSRVIGPADLRIFTRTFRVDDLGIAVLLQIVQSDFEYRLERILDITTFRREGKQVHFSTLWEPVFPPGSQGELPHRLGVYFYEHPDEVKAGLRIRPDYLIDMQDRQLLIHEPSGDDERLFLYRDPGPM